MKKFILSLMALVATMNINAQIIKVMKGGIMVETYTADKADKVVFEKASAPATTGTTQRTGKINVNWVQLWKDGPKFAEYNVGAENNKAEDYGGYYCWGGTYMNGSGITWVDDHNKGTSNLTGTDDTATQLWGDNWRMPTKEELEILINPDYCNLKWIDGSTEKYNGTTITGWLITGKGDYSSNSVFFPAGGKCYLGSIDYYFNGYWSSTPDGNGNAYSMKFDSGTPLVEYKLLDDGYSVRAVLNE